MDISSTVIRQMSSKHADVRPDMKFLQMDLLEVYVLVNFELSIYAVRLFIINAHFNGVTKYCIYVLTMPLPVD